MSSMYDAFTHSCRSEQWYLRCDLTLSEKQLTRKLSKPSVIHGNMLRCCLLGCGGLGSASCELYHGGMTGLAPYNPDSQKSWDAV